VTEQADNEGRKNAAAAIERALRDAHQSGVSRAELDAIVERATVTDVDRARLRRLVAELHGERPARQRAIAPAPAPELVQPQNPEAEEHVVGAMMLSPNACRVVRELLHEDGRDFYSEKLGRIYRSALRLVDAGVDVNAITLTDELEKTGDLEQVGGRVRLHELAALVPATANVHHYARIVADLASVRGLIKAGGEIARLGWERPGDTGDLLDRARAIAEAATAPTLHIQVRERIRPGGAFIFDHPDTQAAVWGAGDEIAWAAGEGLMLAGPQGVGKTTLVQQLALARIGLRDNMLGLPVVRDERRLLYLAADRPAQARRSLARMVTRDDRQLLDERLAIHEGPPEQLVDHDPRVLVRLCEHADAGTLVVDSLKDIALELSREETGAKVNLAFQYVIAAGVELIVLHHQRKASTDNKTPRKLDDVFGSGRITSGLGSVLLLWGEPGDVLVELRHLKQPSEEIGPWNLQHDHVRGHTERVKQVELVDVVYRASSEGVTATAAAEVVFQKETPTRNEVEKIRARLERLADNGDVVKKPGSRGNDAPRYVHKLAAGDNA
jgi:replicative DNA helicase